MSWHNYSGLFRLCEQSPEHERRSRSLLLWRVWQAVQTSRQSAASQTHPQGHSQVPIMWKGETKIKYFQIKDAILLWYHVAGFLPPVGHGETLEQEQVRMSRQQVQRWRRQHQRGHWRERPEQWSRWAGVPGPGQPCPWSPRPRGHHSPGSPSRGDSHSTSWASSSGPPATRLRIISLGNWMIKNWYWGRQPLSVQTQSLIQSEWKASLFGGVFVN